MGQTPHFWGTDRYWIRYVCPPIRPLNHAHNGANSAALLPGCMWNMAPCVCRSGVGRRSIWNQLSGDQLISTQSIPPRLSLRFYPPKLPLSLVSSSPNCPHWLIVAFNGWCSTCKHSACCWPPIAITSSSSHCCPPIAIVLLPSLKCCCRRHQHHLHRQRRRHRHHRRHHRHHRRRHCRSLHHCRHCRHHCRCFNDAALSSLYHCAFWRPIGGAGLNHSSPNCPHWLIVVVLDGWRSTCKRSACCCLLSPSYHHPIVVVKPPLSNHHPQIAAAVVINIVAVGSSGGISDVAVAVAIAISPIAIVAVIIDVASSTLLCHRRRNGGGASFFGTYSAYSYVGYSARPLVVCGNECFWWSWYHSLAADKRKIWQ